jgi:type I restriction enzyme S subunit
VCSTWSGGTPSRANPDFYVGSIPWIKSGEVNNAVVTSTEECISEEAVKKSAAKLVEPGTILVAMYGATAGVVSVSAIHAAINQAILAVKASSNVLPDYLLHAVEFRMETTKRLTQGGQPNLNAQIIRAALIGFPSMSEQSQIAEALDASKKSVISNQNQLDRLRTEKKALMQQLLTGQRRVVV